jgi:alpha-D-xyloside xylohydrolase
MEVMSSKNISPWNFDKNGPEGSHEALDIYRKYAVLHMSLFPYRYAAAQQAAKTGMPMMRALVLNYQDDAKARATKDEYLFGPDFLVAPVIDEGTQRAAYLPAGEWVDYWTGKREAGGKVVVADAPVDVIPVWVRAGAVVPKIPEDVMTLVPQKESGNTTVKSLDERRVYEVIGSDAADTTLTDFEGRTVVREGRSLKIAGSPAKVTVRWRFGSVAGVRVNGAPVTVQAGADGPYVEFSHASESNVAWEQGALRVEPAPAPVAVPAPVTPVPVAPVVPERRGARGKVPAAASAAPAAATSSVSPAAPKASVHHTTRRSRRAAARKKAKAKAAAKPQQ